MKCYFTFNNDVENNKTYTNMLEAALKSANENTSLDLHALYDGSENDKLYSLLKKYNVKIHLCKLAFYDLLEYFYNDEEYNSLYNFNKNQIKQIGCNFMKFEIPLFEKEDEVVLYSDMDVIFMRDLDYENLHTKTLMAAPEFEQNYDKIKGYSYFNAGIMVLNVKELEKRRNILFEMLKNKQRPYQECWDQGFFNEIYKDDYEKLDLKYNWKPYWGISDDARIVHLHGLKPLCFSKSTMDLTTTLLNRCKESFDGWIYYFVHFCKILQKDELKCAIATAKFLSLCKETDRKKWRISSSIVYNLYEILNKSRFKTIFNRLIEYLDKKLTKRNIIASNNIEKELAKINQEAQ